MLQGIPEAVKDLFTQDSIRKNFRVQFVNSEYRDLVNSDIVSESVIFTESICSSNPITFGLAENSSLEFKTYFNANIRNLKISAYIEIDVSSLDADVINAATTTSDVPYPYWRIFYGSFYVDSCKLDSQSGIRTIIAYQQKKSNYGNNLCDLTYNQQKKISNYICDTKYSGISDNNNIYLNFLSCYIEDKQSYDILDKLGIPYTVNNVTVSNYAFNYWPEIAFAYDIEETSNPQPGGLAWQFTDIAVQASTISTYNYHVDYDTNSSGAPTYAEKNLVYNYPIHGDNVIYIKWKKPSYQNNYSYLAQSPFITINNKPRKDDLCERYSEFKYNRWSSEPNNYWQLPSSQVMESGNYYYAYVYLGYSGNTAYHYPTANSEEEPYAYDNTIGNCVELSIPRKVVKKNVQYWLPAQGETVVPVDPKNPSYVIKTYYSTEYIYSSSEQPIVEIKEITINPSTEGGLYMTSMPFKLKQQDLGLYENEFPEPSHSTGGGDEIIIIDPDDEGDVVILVEQGDRVKYTSDMSLDSIKNINLTDYLHDFAACHCYFLKYNRNNVLSFVKLTHQDKLFPANNLYPSNSLYPVGNYGFITRSLCKSAWWDDEVQRPYDLVIFRSERYNKTYSYDVVNTASSSYEPNAYKHFDLNESKFADDLGRMRETEIRTILQNIANQLKALSYVAASIDMRALPYIEAGDEILVLTKDSGILTFALRQRISGVQALMTSIEAK